MTTVQTSKHWQLDLEAAKRYQEIPVPTILGPAAHALVDKVKLNSGSMVLDHTCPVKRNTSVFIVFPERLRGSCIHDQMALTWILEPEIESSRCTRRV